MSDETEIRPFRVALPQFTTESYPTLAYYHQADRGGHFAAWEEPALFATEIRAAFRPLR